jgi:hypothetical protein
MAGIIIGFFLILIGTLLFVATFVQIYCPKTNRGVNKLECQSCLEEKFKQCKKADRLSNLISYIVSGAFIIGGLLLLFWGVF